MPLSDPERLAVALLRSRWVLLVGTILVLGLLLTASIPWPDNRFTIEATTRQITLSAAGRAEHNIGITLPPGTKLELTGYEVAQPPDALRDLLYDGRPVTLQGVGIVLTSILLDQGGKLIVTVPSAGRLELELAGRARLGVSLGGAVFATGPDGSMKLVGVFQRSEPVAASAKPGAESLRVVITGSTWTSLPFTLRDQPLSGVSFARPRASTAETRFPFRSEILKGTLSMLDTGAAETLRPGELVWLGNISAFLVLLNTAPDGLMVDISGEARSVGVGPARGDGRRPDRDLTPSVLGYVAKQYELKLLWGTAVVILAALWRAREWARKQRN